MIDAPQLYEGPAQAPRKVEIAFHDVSYNTASGRKILNNLSFTIERGDTLALLGRSGSGKTTALKLINRLYKPSAGEVLVQGHSTTEWDPIALRRRIGYVIQEGGLFPHYTIEKNIALLPRLENWPETKISVRVEQLFSMVGLSFQDFRSRYPHELSGGQRQRVGVARALAADPPILLMDEPFGALDPITRAELQKEFLQLQQHFDKTVVLVTHDLREALLLGSCIALIEEGRLIAITRKEHFLNLQESSVREYLKPFLAAEDLLKHV